MTFLQFLSKFHVSFRGFIATCRSKEGFDMSKRNFTSGAPVDKGKILAIAMALFGFLAYVPIACWSSYERGADGPPSSAGIRLRIPMPYVPLTPVAVTARGHVGLFEDSENWRNVEVWEGNRRLVPAILNEVVSLGRGRYRYERGKGPGAWITFSSTDNTDPMTNGRTYWVVNPGTLGDGPPPSAGIRLQIQAPYTPMTTNAVTARDRAGYFEDEEDWRSVEVWEGNKRLIPATLNEVVSLGQGRYTYERGRGAGAWITWSSSDNSNPMTNGRTYWVVSPRK
jgi:hypothetical protein